MIYSFINNLCESHLIPSKVLLKHWDAKKLAELCYLYFLALRILLDTPDTRDWAKRYCIKAGENNDFATWRTTGNDLYVMLHALSVDPDDTDDQADAKFLDRLNITPGIIRHWLRQATHPQTRETHRLFMRLDSMFRIDSAAMRSLRLTVMEWDKTDEDEQHDVVVKLIQMIHTRAPGNSEVLPELKRLDRMDESATAGATGAASIAAVAGGLGAGFDPDGQWRSIYANKRKMRRKFSPPGSVA